MGTFKVNGTEYGEHKRRLQRLEELTMEAPEYLTVSIDIEVNDDQLEEIIADLEKGDYSSKNYDDPSGLTEEEIDKREMMDKAIRDYLHIRDKI